METLFLYVLPAFICALFTAERLTSFVKTDLKWHNCVTLGTILIGIGMLAAMLIPVVNIFYALFSMVATGIIYEDEIQAWLSKPACDLFKKGA